MLLFLDKPNKIRAGYSHKFYARIQRNVTIL